MTVALGGGGDLNVHPDPVVEGQDVEVTYTGSKDLYYSVDGGPWQPLTLDGKGTAKLTAPPGARSILFSDRDILNGVERFVEVYSTSQS